MSMRFGIHVGQQNITIEDLRRLWTFADGHGFGWMSIWDHFYCATSDVDPHFEAVALLGAMASETRNLRFGCMVFATPYRNIGLLAKSAITIDHLSGGRFEIGMGAGWHEPEFRAFNYPFPPLKERMDMLEEGLQVMRSFLDNEVTDHHGRFFDFSNAYMNPRPLGKLPLWIGGTGEKRTASLAAKYSDGWNIPYIGPGAYQHRSNILDELATKAGRDPSKIARATQLGFFMAASDDPQEMARAEGVMKEKIPHQPPSGQLAGNPAQVTERIGKYRDAGVTDLNLAIRPPVDWEALEAFVEQVMPEFR
jgi:alkanesulfonate monooxygenase SsuD/methylene tetrahydromethanopterin reductase-like flavin-dependent oxidoreductase (luciferase family)